MKELDEQTAIAWFNKMEWKNGLSTKPHPTVNKLVFARQYHNNQEVWDKSLAFLRDNDLNTIDPGKYEIDGEHAFAIITEAPSKTFDAAKWEAHLKYIDIQYVIRGAEKIGITPLALSTVSKPYDEANDYANYEAEGTFYTATPAEFFLFFPEDVHRPNILIEGFEVVKKIVIKVQIAK